MLRCSDEQNTRLAAFAVAIIFFDTAAYAPYRRVGFYDAADYHAADIPFFFALC